ncbi:MAG: oligosaccharide flippase family protein, partial [Erysipelotrichaceae bacterium]|nr:oligosaccharide flippase family protein [Erysipelotrichaceae bacterium]
SFIAGALTGAAWVFIAKFLGLLYIVPFTAMATGSNMVFYNGAYTYYDFLLQICTAGIPFAIATLVSKYGNREDFKTVVLIRKLSMSIMLISGFTMAILFVAVSKPLAGFVMGTAATAEDVEILQKVFMILAVAVILVPFLSSYRGFYQGLKEMKAYAISQVIEQISRVFFLLVLGAICVYVFKLESITAVYMACVATSIAALCGILYYRRFDKDNYYVIKRAARMQTKPAEEPKKILKELLWFGIPYLLSSILGNSMNLVNTNFFMSTMDSAGYSYEMAKGVLAVIQVQCNRLTSIPQVLSIGFSAGIVPFLTIALENKDYSAIQKHVTEALDSVLYIGVPLSFCLFSLARPIFYVMYGNDLLDYGEICLAWSSLIAITGTVAPICTSMMLTLKYRKRSIIYLGIGFIVKLVTFFPLIYLTGYVGAITSTVITSCT